VNIPGPSPSDLPAKAVIAPDGRTCYRCRRFKLLSGRPRLKEETIMHPPVEDIGRADLSVLQNGSKATLLMDPFPHLVIEPALPSAVYGELAEKFPESVVIERGVHETDVTCRYAGRRVLRDEDVTPIWQAFFRYHTSADFFREAVDLLEPGITRFYPERLAYLQNARTVPRKMGRAEIELECQFVVNLPAGKSVRTVHLDNPRELYAILFYLRKPDDDSDGGNLQVLSARDGPVRLNRSREADTDGLGCIKEIDYGVNKAVIFLNTPRSYHGVTARSNVRLNRRYVNIIAEVPKGFGLPTKRTRPWFRLPRFRA
jgi:hypothetical protein